MASYPPSTCCTVGVKHEGNATGKFEHLNGIECYIATPKETSEFGILVLPDVHGHRFPNCQFIVDAFASNGYFTVSPDYFSGDPIPAVRGPDFEMDKWRANKTPELLDPIVEKVIKALKEEHGIKKLALVGYCFGAKYVVRFLKKGVSEAGYVAHPSWVEVSELKSLEGPLSIAAAETDRIFPPEKRHETEKILQELGQPYQINLFSGVSHGFAVRGDLSNKSIRFAKEQAFLQAVAWFDAHLDKRRE